MRYYEFISGFRGRYKSLFGFEYSILKRPSWAGITVLPIPFPGPSEMGTHENILHFPPRFTRCILWQLDWKSIPRDCVIEVDSRASCRQTEWYLLSSACPPSYPSVDTWICWHRGNILNPYTVVWFSLILFAISPRAIFANYLISDQRDLSIKEYFIFSLQMFINNKFFIYTI